MKFPTTSPDTLPAGDPDYLADGVHLYEVLERTPNHGLLGGEFVTVVNCLTDERRELDPCEAALCETARRDASR